MNYPVNVCEYDYVNAELVRKIQMQDDAESNLLLLYQQNKGFIAMCVKLYTHCDKNCLCDYKQIAFLAMLRAVKGFDFKFGTKFLTYYKYWLRHYLTDFEKRNTYTADESGSANDFLFNPRFRSVNDQTEYTYSYLNLYRDRSIERVETSIYKRRIWEEVRNLLEFHNYICVYYRFVKNLKYPKIAEILQINPDTARIRVLRSLRVLGKSSTLKKFACDLYGIKV